MVPGVKRGTGARGGRRPKVRRWLRRGRMTAAVGVVGVALVIPLTPPSVGAMPSAGLVAPVAMDGFTRLVASDYFLVDRFAATDAGVPLGLSGKMQMLFALGEGVSVESDAGVVSLDPWRVLVLPAEGVEYSLRGAGEVIRIAQP